LEQDTEQNTSTMSLTDYWDILYRRRLVVLQTFIVIALTGTVITLMTRPVYKASARLLVEPPSTDVNTVDSSNPLSQILTLTPTQNVATQVEVLQSQPLVQKVLKTTGPAILDVEEVKDTNIIEVSAEANSRDVAAAVPNLLLQTYIQEDVDQGLDEIRGAMQFAQNQETEAHSRLASLDNQILDFKLRNNVDDLTLDHTTWSQRTQDLTKQIQTNQATIAADYAQLADMQRDFSSAPSVLVTSMPTMNPDRPALTDEIAKLQADRVAMTQKGGYTSQAPEVVALDARMAELHRQLAAQPVLLTSQVANVNAAKEALRGKIEDVKADIASTNAQNISLNAQLAAAGSHISRFATWQSTYDGLIRQRDAAQAADTMFADKVTDLSLREQAHHATAHIIQPAQMPVDPIKPLKIPSILFSCFIGLFAGVGLALLQDFLDDRINSPDEVVRLLRLPTLGHIPVWDAGPGRLLTQMGNHVPAAESYRLLRTNIHFAAVDKPTRTLLVTSTNPGEGKTTTSANLACAMALDGKNVILVDSDLRRPSIHKIFEVMRVPGLTDVILGHSSLDDALQPYELLPNLHILPAGSIAPNPSELLNSRKFAAIFADLRSRADVVIFDSPPVLVAADAPILASQTDGSVLVVETGSTKKAAAVRAAQILQQARANVMGISYNKMTAQSGSGYYYYAYHALEHDRIDEPEGAPMPPLDHKLVNSDVSANQRALGNSSSAKDEI